MSENPKVLIETSLGNITVELFEKVLLEIVERNLSMLLPDGGTA